MFRINSGYIAVREVNLDKLKSKYFYTKTHSGASRFAEVIGVHKDSFLKTKDVVLHDKDIMFFAAKDLGVDCYYVLESDINAKLVGKDVISIRESVYVKVNREAKHQVEINGTVFKKDVEYNEFDIEHRTQHGEVVSVPLVATNSYIKGDNRIPIDIKVGDIVYSHHFITHDDNEREINGEKVYEIRYEECYCRERKGKITMLNEWNLVEPIDEDESNLRMGKYILKENKEKESDLGILIHLSSRMKEIGVNSGEKVLFKHHRDYPIIVNNKLYYRVNTRDIVAVNN